MHDLNLGGSVKVHARRHNTCPGKQEGKDYKKELYMISVGSHSQLHLTEWNVRLQSRTRLMSPYIFASSIH